VLWDMPGSGTENHPLGSYFKDKVLYAFDCLLITADSKRLGEEQIKLINEAQKYNTPVVLIIVMLDEAVKNEVEAQFEQNQDYEPTLDQYRPIVEQTIEKLKSYAESQQKIVPRSRIFVISAKKFRALLNSIDPQNGTYNEKYFLLSGEMLQLFQHIISESSRRRN
jgi:GTPase Era involved in 16S rRNA processing